MFSPQVPISQLDAFVSELYLRNRAGHVQLCWFLWVHAPDLPDEENIVVECDAPVNPEFKLLPTRMSFGQVHMGKSLDERPLIEKTFSTQELSRTFATQGIQQHMKK